MNCYELSVTGCFKERHYATEEMFLKRRAARHCEANFRLLYLD